MMTREEVVAELDSNCLQYPYDNKTGTCETCKYGLDLGDAYNCTEIDSVSTVWTTKDFYCSLYEVKQ